MKGSLISISEKPLWPPTFELILLPRDNVHYWSKMCWLDVNEWFEKYRWKKWRCPLWAKTLSAKSKDIRSFLISLGGSVAVKIDASRNLAPTSGPSRTLRQTPLLPACTALPCSLWPQNPKNIHRTCKGQLFSTNSPIQFTNKKTIMYTNSFTNQIQRYERALI